MNRPSILPIASLILTIALLGCSKTDNAPTQSGGGKWTVSGNAHLVGSVDPLAGVVVTCAGLSTASATNGSYEIRGVPEGSQTITAQRAGCEDYSHSIEVKSDVRYDIFLIFNGADLSGFVTNSVDGPIQGARVAYHGLAAFTDSSGRYQISPVSRGTDTIYVTHPLYTANSTALSLNSAEQKFDVVLKRDSLVQVNISLARYVDEIRPNSSALFPLELLSLMSNGYDSLGVYHGDVERHIYINFDYPQLLTNRHVSIVDASLQICTDAPYPPCGFQTFSIKSLWGGTITYNNQPVIGSLLFSGLLGDSTSARYFSLLDANAFNQLLADYRSEGRIYGVVIKGGKVVPTNFYSPVALQNQPKMMIKMRY